ncbi:MAG: hypothetical protein JWP69_2170 [Flaviaesturariibacter sp.]|nr:hypothetical protein [Flaviaesturariibacter sp.]
MSRFFAMTIPVLPGREAAWHQFMNELKGDKRKAYQASRRRLGVRERVFYQQGATGNAVILTFEGENAEGAWQMLATSDSPFSEWYFEQVANIHGISVVDVLLTPPPPQLADSGPVLEKTGAPFSPSAS